ncbi:cysteine peptidase family C39 domain-containing protein [Ureaplasma miroungigenitalium]|uniref:cysteine peptidase family C39 domain-containing protein n=1 Tax=Ureaplasma miroungigenitalium TaxID=1042321 RepID=UPI0021E7D7CD|nr:cysteine peptidase family C39 domain-containing protein [Ureaplasma miroungigenitalium]MCV3734167.1 cysteine peptidase family C39 domain-containing protein [Ureaplasma miroungigenitalium]
MRVIQQTNKNECGVCVITMMFNYLYQQKISKIHVLEKSVLSEEGMNLNEFERLAAEFSLSAQSYKCHLDELLNLHPNKYLVLMVQSEGRNHFIIVQIYNREKIDVYDPQNGYHQTDMTSLQKRFLNVAILFEKNEKLPPKFNLKPLFNDSKIFSWKLIVFLIFLEGLGIGFSILSSKFVTYIIDWGIAEQEIRNAVVLTVLFSFIFLTNQVRQKLVQIIIHKKSEEITLYILYFTLKRLTNKQQWFFNKTNLSELLGLEGYIQTIINFKISALANFISALIFALIVNVLMLKYNTQLFIISLIIGLLSVLINFWAYGANMKNQLVIIKNNHDKFLSLEKLLSFVQKESDVHKLTFYLRDLIRHNEQYVNNQKRVVTKQSIISFCANITQDFGFLFLVLITSLLVIQRNQNINIGSLMYIIFLHQNINQNYQKIFHFFMLIPGYKYAYETLYKISVMNNRINNYGFLIDRIQNIYLKKQKKLIDNHTLIKGPNGCGKTTLLKQILNGESVLFNNQPMEQLANSFLQQKIVYLPGDATIFPLNWHALISDAEINANNQLIQLLTKAQINTLASLYDDKQWSTGQRQIVNFLRLLQKRNNLILLDEALANVDWEIKGLLLKAFMPVLQRYNLVICVSHDIQMNNFFKEVINFEF